MSPLVGMLPEDRWNRSLIAAFLVLWAVSCIRIPYPDYFVMQHVPTVLAAITLVVADRKHVVDRLGFTFIVLFLTLHLLGARYLYSFVPYDEWTQKLFGVSITEQFGFQRNHYDRIVHVCFGLLFVYPAAWFFQQRLRLAGWWPEILAVCMILAAQRRLRNRRMARGHDVRTRLGRRVQWTAGRPLGRPVGHGVWRRGSMVSVAIMAILGRQKPRLAN